MSLLISWLFLIFRAILSFREDKPEMLGQSHRICSFVIRHLNERVGSSAVFFPLLILISFVLR